jgi:hypothetical protein
LIHGPHAALLALAIITFFRLTDMFLTIFFHRARPEPLQVMA